MQRQPEVGVRLQGKNATRCHAPIARVLEAVADEEPSSNPEHEVLLAHSVGLALLVVMDKLSPSERLAFVLHDMHDMFDVPFNDIARVVSCSPPAARQLASRAASRARCGRKL